MCVEGEMAAVALQLLLFRLLPLTQLVLGPRPLPGLHQQTGTKTESTFKATISLFIPFSSGRFEFPEG